MSGAPHERGRFITLEGPEGSGKSTAARHLAEWLRDRGVRAVLTHEPGGTPLGEEVRRIVLHMRGMSDDLDPRADALLYAAARAQHVARVIRPALERGEWVVCARYLDSSLAYQGAGYGNDRTEMRRLQEFATDDLLPDLTLLLDVPVELGLERTRRRAEWNRFEDTEEVAFFERVRGAYLALAAAEPDRFEIIDGSGTVEQADAAIRAWSSAACSRTHARRSVTHRTRELTAGPGSVVVHPYSRVNLRRERSIRTSPAAACGHHGAANRPTSSHQSRSAVMSRSSRTAFANNHLPSSSS